MINRSDKIQALLKTSYDVIRESILDNGAIISSPSQALHGSHERLVRPRQAAITAVAANLLAIPAGEKFFHWLFDKAEGFANEKLLYSTYTTSGKIGKSGRVFEPDQMGFVLWALHSISASNKERILPHQDLIRRLADGLVAVWDKQSFIPDAIDFWSDDLRPAHHRENENYVLSLAACYRGLLAANEFIPTKAWKKTAQQMKKKIDEAEKEGWERRPKDSTKDASLLGLIWPFEIISTNNNRADSLLETIERAISTNGGLHRFEHDYPRQTWPALNCWMAIALQRAGNREHAEHFLTWVVDRTTDVIPEQYFHDFRKKNVASTWSHAMFVLACSELNIPLRK